jgi:SanA protein
MAWWRRPRSLLAAGGALAVLGVAFVTAASAYVRSQALGRVHGDPRAVPARAVAIVLGARVWDREPSPMLEERLRGALALYRGSKVAKVLVSGDHGGRTYDEVNAMGAWLERAGVPPADVFLDHAGFRTLDTMERAARVFGVTSAVVCTQGFHLARALFLARRAGIDAVGLEAVEPTWSAAAWNRVRERLAQAEAVLDTYVLHRGPRFLGPPIPIAGDGRVTRDEPGPGSTR